jgi:hypothetical protein
VRERNDTGVQVMEMGQRNARPATVLGLFAVLFLMSACTKTPEPNVVPAVAISPYKPTATFQEIMDSVVDSSGDYIWQAVSTKVDAKGTHETRPQTAAQWHEFRQRAIMLVEAANLIAVPGRRVAIGATTVEDGGPLEVDKIQHRLDTQHDALVGFAGALRDIGQKLVDAADRQDVAAVIQYGGTLDEVCEACHKVFWYPEESQTASSAK